MVTITVANVNEAPIAVDFGTPGSTSATTLQSAQAGDVLGTLRATDPDNGDTVGFKIVDGNGSHTDASGAFAIMNGQLVVGPDGVAGLMGNQTVWVEAIDAGGLSTWQAVTVTVTEANHAPTASADTDRRRIIPPPFDRN